MALVFTEAVEGEVVVKFGKNEKPVVTSRLNSYVVTFPAPGERSHRVPATRHLLMILCLYTHMMLSLSLYIHTRCCLSL